MSRIEPHGRRVILNQRLVKERDAARAHELRRVLWIGAGLLIPVLFYVWEQVEYIRYGYRIEQFRKDKAQLVEWNRQLKLEKATLESLNRIERLAEKRLGLVPPSTDNTVKVELSGEAPAPTYPESRSILKDGLAAAER